MDLAMKNDNHSNAFFSLFLFFSTIFQLTADTRGWFGDSLIQLLSGNKSYVFVFFLGKLLGTFVWLIICGQLSSLHLCQNEIKKGKIIKNM